MPFCWKPGLTTLLLKMIWIQTEGGSLGLGSLSQTNTARLSQPLHTQGHVHLVGHDAANWPAGQHHTVLVILDNDGLRAGNTVFQVTEVVVNEHTEVSKHGHDLLHQHVCAVIQESVVGAIKCDVVGVTPAAADTCGCQVAYSRASISPIEWLSSSWSNPSPVACKSETPQAIVPF